MEQEHDDKRYYHGTFVATHTVQMDIPDPPPLAFASPFKSIEEWLIHICKTNNPQVNIEDCMFVIMFLSWGNVLSVEGYNKIEIDNHTTAHRIVFKPSLNKNFALPNEEFGSLSQKQLRERVINELKQFTNTDTFQNSFLPKATIIRMDFGDRIWPE